MSLLLTLIQLVETKFGGGHTDEHCLGCVVCSVNASGVSVTCTQSFAAAMANFLHVCRIRSVLAPKSITCDMSTLCVCDMP